MKLKGNVIPTPGKFRAAYTMGNLKFAKKNIDFGKITDAEKKTQNVIIYNSGKIDLKIEAIDIPDYIKVKIDPPILKPKEKGKLIATFDASKISSYGNYRELIGFKINGNELKNRYNISSFVEKDFSGLSKVERNASPDIYFPNRNFDYSIFKKNPKPIDKISFKNRGKRELKIYNIETSKDIILKDYPKIIKPGAEGKISIELKNKKNRDAFRGFLKVYANDPNHFETIISIITSQKVNKQTRNFFGVSWISPKDFKTVTKKISDPKYFEKMQKQFMISSFSIIDIRAPKDYKKWHYKSAINLFLKSKKIKKTLPILDKKKTLYYVIGYGEEDTSIVAKMMQENDIQHIFCIKGGSKKLQ